MDGRHDAGVPRADREAAREADREAAPGTGPGTGGRLVVAHAPGRVNLLGDHTDYNQGLALPMAVDLGVEVTLAEDGGDRVVLATTLHPGPVVLPLDLADRPGAVEAVGPAWARMAGAVLARARPRSGGTCLIASTVPPGAGLSSSAACCVALALAFGVSGPPAALATLCQVAERAAGADVGLMDPLVIAGAVESHALLVDFATLAAEPVPLPGDVDVVVVHSGQARQVGTSPYAARRAECEAAAAVLGVPLGRAGQADLHRLGDPVLRARARHVVTECRRVRELVAALGAGDLAAAGALVRESHRSLAGDFGASTPVVDALVDEVTAVPGVHGARMTGAGFGGCVVALAEPGALDPHRWPGRAWRVRACGGATVRSTTA